MIIFITGGVRSGKSRYAQDMATSLSQNPMYIATAKKWDDEFNERIKRHREDRDANWTTLEVEKYLSQIPLDDKVAVIDCVTLWLTNFFLDTDQNVDESLKLFRKEIDQLSTANGTLIIISNELGMGIHAETSIGRKFADLQGWANQYIAEKAEKVIFMVSGIPMIIKNETTQLYPYHWESGKTD